MLPDSEYVVATMLLQSGGSKSGSVSLLATAEGLGVKTGENVGIWGQILLGEDKRRRKKKMTRRRWWLECSDEFGTPIANLRWWLDCNDERRRYPASYELVMRGGVGKDVSGNSNGNGWMWFALAAQGNTMVDAGGDFGWFSVAVGDQGWQFLATLGSIFGS
ncbi:unnamed protein product [Lactuca virosa]|uniref:Uncharacterized protein n=1 Tax=Lactuca virosa TaxID=75947 RepID=A0AAU9P653_9ASTR|nr:unnamed protein product [Lactuca virosa]